MARGRPSTYSAIVADAICEELVKGRSLLQISKDPDFPGESTVYEWLQKFPDFAEKYARARELQAEHYAAEIIALADNPVEGRKVVIKPDGSEEITIGDTVERTRLQIDARKWYASKLAPKKYGDRTEHTGANGGPITIANITAADLSDEQLAAIIQTDKSADKA